MSYDLFFMKKCGESSNAEFDAWFASRPGYTVRHGQASYANEDTGVYFSFQLEHEQEPDPDDAAAGLGPRWASFNLNYVRPSVFALEALPELQAFVDTFKLTVRDPQIDGMGTGDFSADGFLRGWTCGNELGIRAILQSHGPNAIAATLPTARLHPIWRWNYGRRQLQETLGESVFVPQIMYARGETGVTTMCAWPDAIPVALPACEAIIIGREQPARGLFKRFRQPETQMILVDMRQVLPLLAKFPLKSDPIEYRLLDYPSPPAELTAFIASLPAGAALPDVLATDAIMDEELVQQTRAKLPAASTATDSAG